MRFAALFSDGTAPNGVEKRKLRNAGDDDGKRRSDGNCVKGETGDKCNSIFEM